MTQLGPPVWFCCTIHTLRQSEQVAARCGVNHRSLLTAMGTVPVSAAQAGMFMLQAIQVVAEALPAQWDVLAAQASMS